MFPMLASYDARTQLTEGPTLSRARRSGMNSTLMKVDLMILMRMMMMTNRTRGAVALPSPMGSFRARLSKEVVTHASQITGSGTTRTVLGIAFTSKCGRSSSGRRMRTFLQVVHRMELDTVRVTHMRGLDCRTTARTRGRGSGFALRCRTRPKTCSATIPI